MQVNITKRIDAPEGKRYSPVIVGPNGRIRHDWVMVNDRQERHPEGAYCLDWNEDGKRRRISVGTDAAAAYNSGDWNLRTKSFPTLVGYRFQNSLAFLCRE
jgi:hypothetical protein